jgi:hypothetical protein
MPQLHILQGYNVEIRSMLNGKGEVEWSLMLIDITTRDVIRFDHSDKVKDFIVSKYTGGVVLGGSPPSV